jgi:hypothetical protein
MNIIDLLTIIIIIAAIGIAYFIYKFISERMSKCGNEPLCYLTGVPNSIDYIKDQIEDQIKDVVNQINPF